MAKKLFPNRLGMGDSGPAVKIFQEYLIQSDYADVDADGEYGPMTVAAVKDMRIKLDLSAELGQLGPQLKAKLREGSADFEPVDFDSYEVDED